MTVVKSKYQPQANQLYETEAWATSALLRHLVVRGKRVWEPAAGNHKLANVLRAAGAEVVTSDRFHYPGADNVRFNFLGTADWGTSPVEHDMHITNPPYGAGNMQAERWIELALERTDGWIALLLTAKFDFGSTRVHMFRDCPRFHAKIALLDRIQWFPGDFGGTEDHAWYIWRPAWAHPGAPPVLLYEGMDENEKLARKTKSENSAKTKKQPKRR